MWIFTTFIVTYAWIFTSNRSTKSRDLASALLERFPTAPYGAHNFGISLSPDHLRRKFSR